jgi:hypothetical protein
MLCSISRGRNADLRSKGWFRQFLGARDSPFHKTLRRISTLCVESLLIGGLLFRQNSAKNASLLPKKPVKNRSSAQESLHAKLVFHPRATTKNENNFDEKRAAPPVYNQNVQVRNEDCATHSKLLRSWMEARPLYDATEQRRVFRACGFPAVVNPQGACPKNSSSSNLERGGQRIAGR